MENATADLLLISYIFLNNHSKDCVKNVVHTYLIQSQFHMAVLYVWL